jgi:DNA-binding PadR family transcriptional regulator
MIYERNDLMTVLTLREEIILSALILLEGSSGGSAIRKKIIELTGKEVVYGTLYNLMEYLMRKGYVTTHKSDPIPVQGGRSKTIYSITEAGRTALQETMALHEIIRGHLRDVKFEV